MFGHWADIELKRETCLKCCGVGLVAPSPLPGISSRSAIEHVEEFSDKDLGAHIFPLEFLNFDIYFDFQKAANMVILKCIKQYSGNSSITNRSWRQLVQTFG